jgi:CBS domain-containing protein
MSPRAAWRLETLGFEHVHHYVGGKADWFANGLPREGRKATVPDAGELVDATPPTCALTDSVNDVRTALEGSRYGFCLVVNDHRIVLGRVRQSAIKDADPTATAESVMEPGPRTFRFDIPAAELAQRLDENELRTAVITKPDGRLVGVFHRADAEARLGLPASP